MHIGENVEENKNKIGGGGITHNPLAFVDI